MAKLVLKQQQWVRSPFMLGDAERWSRFTLGHLLEVNRRKEDDVWWWRIRTWDEPHGSAPTKALAKAAAEAALLEEI